MSYINVGAQINGLDAKTKKALREAMGSAPDMVTFYATAALGPDCGKAFTGDNLPVGDKLSVVGPDPFSKRTWYATVSDGKVS